MAESYKKLSTDEARRIKLVMTDVDGTLLEDGDELIPEVTQSIQRLESLGIAVGLVSGRHMPELEGMATVLGISGPLIAENGGLAKLTANSDLFPLGYSREPAQRAFEKLQRLFPDSIRGRQDNEQRHIDIVLHYDSIPIDTLRTHINDDVELLDSGYILHLIQKDITKGTTLQRLLDDVIFSDITKDNVMVAGDAPTDDSLFKLFPASVLVQNPNLPQNWRAPLKQMTRYESDLSFGQGFAQVARHIIDLRENAS
ncbi:MAG: HAD hydrolase family protein [Chloroflexi bacterium]|jgi:phosphoglycolate phosphatase|nr:HAD hydrolase family protein [Chloroflexota bacterium]MBT7081290.1 HAD hydrolase family protein [Chloroflexota bacterium]MBT7289675.1 HAD hydrolase family protein [Chloroflexota bacterium]